MQGVTILATEQMFSSLWIFILLTILSIIAIIFGIFLCKNGPDQDDAIIGGASISAGIISTVILITFMLTNNLSGYTKYIGTIDNSVSYVEFTEKYELIEKKDNLFIFKDK